MKYAPLLLCLLLCFPAFGDVEWHFTGSSEITFTANLNPVQVGEGRVCGQTRWDPYVYLKLPSAELTVRDLPFLTVRLYSSAKADVLDVYYKCADGRWGLGATLPIHAGWATYRADLRKAQWHETSGGDDAKQWGGPSGRIVSFRIDPGNEADRWVIIQSVALTAKPTGNNGLEIDPRGTASDLHITAPRKVVAGQPVAVSFHCSATTPPKLTRGTVLLRLMSGATPTKVFQQEVSLAGGAISVNHDFPTSPYEYGGEFRVTAQVLELDGGATAPVTVANPRVGTAVPPRTRVADYHGDPALYVNDKPIPLITCVHAGGDVAALHKEIAGAGIKIYTDWFGSSVAGNLGHVQPDVYDYSAFDDYFTTVLDAVPDACFLPHIGVTAPLWWQQMHPEECCLYSDGHHGPSSLASELWKQQMRADLVRLIDHLRKAPYADRILGYIFFSGYTAEWQNWATWQQYGDDYSRPSVKAFRHWLTQKYGSVAQLRTAWHQPSVTFDTAAIPTYERRMAPGPFLRDPATDQQIIDYCRFSSDIVSDAIIHFAHVVKQATGGSQITGTYYGYMAAHGARQQDSGHNALARVLDCPDVDFLMSPPMYANRQAGGTSTFMSATASVRLHGKLWLDESDLRSYLSDPSSGFGRTETPEDSVGATWREFANVLTRRAAVCWFDMAGGWFSGKPLLDAYRRQGEIARTAFARRRPFHGDVALFTDPHSYACFRFSGFSGQMITNTIASMPDAGVTWDFYLLSDIANPKLPVYRVYVVLNGVAMDETTRTALMRRARRDHATVVYIYAPGAVAGAAFDTQRIASATGMAVAVSPHPASDAYTLQPGSSLTAGISLKQVWGLNQSLSPRIVIAERWPSDAGVEVVARYVTDKSVAIARKQVDGVNVIFCASVSMPPDLYRNIAQAAGAHVFCETNDALYYDGAYLALHAASDGEKVIRLPAARRIVDAVSGKLLAAHAAEIRQMMRKGQTRFLELGE